MYTHYKYIMYTHHPEAARCSAGMDACMNVHVYMHRYI